MIQLTVCYYHVTYEFQSVSTLYGLPECQWLLVWSRHHIWSSSDSNKIQTHNHLVCKQTLNHFTKLAKWLSCVVSTYLYGAFDCMLLSCHVRVSGWLYFIICLNVKELLARSRHHISSSSDIQEKHTLIHDMIIINCQMHSKDKYSQHNLQ